MYSFFFKLFYRFAFQGCVLAKTVGSKHACMKSRVPFTVYKHFIDFVHKTGSLKFTFQLKVKLGCKVG